MKQQYIAQSSAIAARMIGDRLMIMSAKDSSLFELNPLGSAIWQCADGQTELREIVATSVSGVEIDSETACRDAEQFVDKLATHGILILSDEPSRIPSVSWPCVPRAPLIKADDAGRRPYEKPSFRYERAFETMALSCGKATAGQGQCQTNRKVS
jgi:Coenzyme PQQ synthesis protein D (PqqD)